MLLLPQTINEHINCKEDVETARADSIHVAPTQFLKDQALAASVQEPVVVPEQPESQRRFSFSNPMMSNQPQKQIETGDMNVQHTGGEWYG